MLLGATTSVGGMDDCRSKRRTSKMGGLVGAGLDMFDNSWLGFVTSLSMKASELWKGQKKWMDHFSWVYSIAFFPCGFLG